MCHHLTAQDFDMNFFKSVHDRTKKEIAEANRIFEMRINIQASRLIEGQLSNLQIKLIEDQFLVFKMSYREIFLGNLYDESLKIQREKMPKITPTHQIEFIRKYGSA